MKSLHAILFLGLTLQSFALGETTTTRLVDYQRDVRPILSNHCFACHGPDEAARKAKLRLDRREELLRKSNSDWAILKPGDPDQSEIVRRIESTDEDEIMPAPNHKRPLTPEQKVILRQWVAQGADVQPHWSFLPPVKPEMPSVAQSVWPRNEVDYFTLARMESEELKPSHEADAPTLVRRVYLDLIGLPPTPEQADRYLNDPSETAYERLVDELLASPHYGERWARRWLDLARYADTNGYEKDRPRSIWPYRDWVIRALNEGMPFDRFTVEQLAGDMLPNATPFQIIATGFHRNTMLNEEGGIDPLEFRFHAMVDRVHVTATSWLGLTMACAQCHTHKYDPIPHKDYYQFMAFLNNADEPTVDVMDPEIRKQRETIQATLRDKESELPLHFPPEREFAWLDIHNPSIEIKDPDSGSMEDDGTWTIAIKDSGNKTFTLQWTTESPVAAWLQLEVIGEDFILGELKLSAASAGQPEAWSAVSWESAESESAAPGHAVTHAIDDRPDRGWQPWRGESSPSSHIGNFQFSRITSWDDKTHWKLQLDSGKDKGSSPVTHFRLRMGVDTLSEENIVQRRNEHFESSFQQWLNQESKDVIAWKPFTPKQADSKLPYLQIGSDGSVFASGDFTKQDTYRLRFEPPGLSVRAIRLEAIADDRLPADGPGIVSYEGPIGDFWLSDIQLLQGKTPRTFQRASQSFANGGNTADKAIDDDLQSGWSINGGQGRDHHAVWNLTEPLSVDEPFEFNMLFERYYAAGLGRFRVWATDDEQATASPHPIAIQQILIKSADQYSEPDLQQLRSYFALTTPALEAARETIQKLKDSMPSHATTLVFRERPHEHPRATTMHRRGEFLSPLEEVQAKVPEILSDSSQQLPSNRLEFARWLVSRDNPLTARVVMNRHWSTFFGNGLVGTLEDFGFQGKLPSHPKLLDWLAVTFMERGWSLKEMHKLIVMSATYRQSSHVTPDVLNRDPENKWLAQGPRFRLEAEMVRDSALVASGLLSAKIGGTSVFPPQPANVTTEGAYGAFAWKVSTGGDRYRRSLYTFMKRTTPFAMLTAFDGPTGESCLPFREQSNTPMQSLTLLNDDMFMEMAGALGRRVAEREGSDAEKMIYLFRRCLVRPPAPGELQELLAFQSETLKRFQQDSLDAKTFLATKDQTAFEPESATWAAIARVLFNLDEMITKN